MTDLRYMGKNNQKKTCSMCVPADIKSADYPMNNHEIYKLFTIPENSLITRVYLISGNLAALGKIQVTLRTTYKNNVVDQLVHNDFLAIPVSQAFLRFLTPIGATSDILVHKGSGSMSIYDEAVFRIAIEFIELGLSTGDYTI